jgi:hypothetical protein
MKPDPSAWSVRPTGHRRRNTAIAGDLGAGMALADLEGMRVERELQIVTMSDIALYAEAHGVARLVREAAIASAGREPALVGRFRHLAATLTAAVAEALCPPDDRYAVRRLRQTDMLLEELRRQAFVLFRSDALSAPMFDEIMCATTRCRHEASDLHYILRHRLLWRGQGLEVE